MNTVRVSLKPIRRSKLRLFAGKRYFICKRYWQWLTRPGRQARTRSQENLPHSAMAHATPLLRSLRNVDMQMQINKITNLRLAIAKLDGLILRSGEAFSYWRNIGKPTRRKGYLDGMVLHYGGFHSGVGGGLCQLSNLIYWMTLHTPLTITERHRHSYDVFPDEQRTQPFGSGATCSYNYLDLQLRNPTEHSYQLRLWLDDTHLHGEWRCSGQQLYSYEVYESDHRISLEPWGGYIRSNQISRRVFTMSGELAMDEEVTGNYALMMYSPLLQG
ncbi:VanW family protein [Paenibacillus donghaensis]|uniref:Vancomycin resistance protein n=1 Tax=Paenibacillus donghaensis TaxID=414771 RepID=A0A2Z2K8U1_9BACL|nr:VanW family protein [Paenibacillus donghaensis]ASA21737.1 vancomycin resistance protein [Paenibacillus donghaensis]